MNTLRQAYEIARNGEIRDFVGYVVAKNRQGQTHFGRMALGIAGMLAGVTMVARFGLTEYGWGLLTLSAFYFGQHSSSFCVCEMCMCNDGPGCGFELEDGEDSDDTETSVRV